MLKTEKGISIARNVNNGLLVIGIVLMIVSTLFHIRTYYALESIKRDALMQRKMLDARAKNQQIFFDALNRASALTPQETYTILNNWKDAEYYIQETQK